MVIMTSLSGTANALSIELSVFTSILVIVGEVRSTVTAVPVWTAVIADAPVLPAGSPYIIEKATSVSACELVTVFTACQLSA